VPQNLIGGTFEAKHIFSVIMFQIKHAIRFWFGNQAPGAEQVNEFGTDGGAHNQQVLQPVIQNQLDMIPRQQIVGAGEGIVEDDFFLALIGKVAPLLDDNAVDGRIFVCRQGNRLAGQRLFDSFQRSGDFEYNAGQNTGHTGNIGQSGEVSGRNFFQLH